MRQVGYLQESYRDVPSTKCKIITYLFGVQATEKKNTKTITTFMMPVIFRLFLLNRGETARQEEFSTFPPRP